MKNPYTHYIIGSTDHIQKSDFFELEILVVSP